MCSAVVRIWFAHAHQQASNMGDGGTFYSTRADMNDLGSTNLIANVRDVAAIEKEIARDDARSMQNMYAARGE